MPGKAGRAWDRQLAKRAELAAQRRAAPAPPAPAPQPPAGSAAPPHAPSDCTAAAAVISGCGIASSSIQKGSHILLHKKTVTPWDAA